MRRTTTLSVLLIPAVVAPPDWPAAEPARLELKWSELAGAIVRKKIGLVLPGGVQVQGTATAVEPDALRLDQYAKGPVMIPPASSSRLEPTTYIGVVAPLVDVMALAPVASDPDAGGPQS